MREVVSRIAKLDRLVHSPPRLAILTALRGCQSADFMFLLTLTGLTRGNLSTHLRKLEEAKLLRIRKQFRGQRPQTTVALTALGKKTIDTHWRELTELRERGMSAANERATLAT